MSKRFTPRPYQEEAITAGVDFFNDPARENGIIVAPTGSGKSLIISEIANRLDENVLVFQPSKEILQQNYDKMLTYVDKEEVGVYSSSMGSGKKAHEIKKITFATIGSVKNHIEEFKHFKHVMVDECFTGETEILTEKGFQRFDRLDKTLKVAQWHEGRISFVTPRHIERDHEGTMKVLHVRHNIGIPMTCGHEILLRKGYHYVKERADAFKGGGTYLPLTGETAGDGHLTDMERLYIAFQADGTLHRVTREKTRAIFSFTKERKIERFLSLCQSCGIKVVEVKDKNEKRRRFIADYPAGTTKFIRKHIPFPMGAVKAREVIEECALWDGSVINDHMYYYCSTVEDNADFYSEVAAVSGYSCYKTREVDNRKYFHKDVHRVFIHTTKREKTTRNIYTTDMEYTGKVYCVDVPSHNIVVRHRGFTLVTGNCHLVSGEKGMYLNFLSMLDCKVLGLTATPFRLYSETYWEPHAKKLFAPNGQPVLDRHGNQRYEGGMRTKNAKLVMLTNDENRFFHKIVYLIQIGDLLKQGFLANIKYFDVRPDGWRDERIFTNSEGSEFSAKSVKYMMEQTGHTDFLIRLVRRLLQPKGGRPANGILVFTQFVEDAKTCCQGVADSAFLCAETDKTNRKRILDDFKSGKIKVLFNSMILSTGFDLPSLNTVVLARPTMSLALMYQQVGRVIRPYKDKEAWLIDTVGNVGRFGEVGNLFLGYSQLTNQNEFFGWVKDWWSGEYQWKQLTGVYLKGAPE